MGIEVCHGGTCPAVPVMSSQPPRPVCVHRTGRPHETIRPFDGLKASKLTAGRPWHPSGPAGAGAACHNLSSDWYTPAGGRRVGQWRKLVTGEAHGPRVSSACPQRPLRDVSACATPQDGNSRRAVQNCIRALGGKTRRRRADRIAELYNSGILSGFHSPLFMPSQRRVCRAISLSLPYAQTPCVAQQCRSAVLRQERKRRICISVRGRGRGAGACIQTQPGILNPGSRTPNAEA